MAEAAVTSEEHVAVAAAVAVEVASRIEAVGHPAARADPATGSVQHVIITTLPIGKSVIDARLRSHLPPAETTAPAADLIITAADIMTTTPEATTAREAVAVVVATETMISEIVEEEIDTIQWIETEVEIETGIAIGIVIAIRGTEGIEVAAATVIGAEVMAAMAAAVLQGAII